VQQVIVEPRQSVPLVVATPKLVRLFDVSPPAPYGCFVVSPRATDGQGKIVRFRNWLVIKAEVDRLARLSSSSQAADAV